MPEQRWNPPHLSSCVAVVTGASRGAGRGIALVLGECGATVYATGRSVRGGATPDSIGGTIEDTADAVTERGGHGIPVRCDHTVDAEVDAAFARVRDEQGRLDLLVNNAWGGYEGHDVAEFTRPLWEQPLARRWEAMFTAGVRAQLLSARAAAPLMIARRRGLIVNTTAWLRGGYLGNLVYDTAKAAINRIAFGLAEELRAHNVCALALTPGFMRTERVLAAFAGMEDHEALAATESVEYVGRAVATLAADANVMARSGGTCAVGDLAREYGFTDIDGTQPLFEVT